MCLDFESLSVEARHRRHDQKRRVITSIPKTTAATIFLTAEATRLLDVQFRLEDALVAVATDPGDSPRDGGKGDGAGHISRVDLGRQTAAAHLREAIPLCQEIGERLVLAAQTSFKFVTEALAPSQDPVWNSSGDMSPKKAPGSVKEEELGHSPDDEAPSQNEELAPGREEEVAPGFFIDVIKTKEEEEGSEGEHLAYSPLDEKCYSDAECNESVSSKREIKKHKKMHKGKASKKQTLRTSTGEKSFRCSVCTKSFPKPSRLRVHERSHTGEKPFPCTICGKAFTVSSHLTVHMRTHTGEKPYPCSQCDKWFATATSLKKHEPIHSDKPATDPPVKKELDANRTGRPYCAECDKSFCSAKSYNAHMMVHSGEKLFNCSECSQSFRRKATMLSHMKIHTGEKPFNCSTCGKLFRVLVNLKRHERTHTGEKPFCCDHCKKAFNQSTALIVHMRIHTGEKPFVCSTCGHAFRSSTAMRQHEQQAHSELAAPKVRAAYGTAGTPSRSHEKVHQCSECPKAFTCMQNLEIHMRKHTGEKPFICQTCAKAFISAGQLKIHETVHTGEKPHACSQCTKTFRTDQQLKVHIRVHTGEKPYSCSECSKAFAQWTHLQTHLRIHTGEKLYSCSVCNKAFAQKGNLKGHMKVHTGETYYKKRPAVPKTLGSSLRDGGILQEKSLGIL